jgi:hypothetical protein
VKIFKPKSNGWPASAVAAAGSGVRNLYAELGAPLPVTDPRHFFAVVGSGDPTTEFSTIRSLAVTFSHTNPAAALVSV